MDDDKTAYIYLLQDASDKGSCIYKVGRTMQGGGDSRKLNRLQSYSKGTIVENIFRVQANNVNKIESEIKAIFNNKFILSRGTEWFEGDVKIMKKDISAVIENYERTESIGMVFDVPNENEIDDAKAVEVPNENEIDDANKNIIMRPIESSHVCKDARVLYTLLNKKWSCANCAYKCGKKYNMIRHCYLKHPDACNTTTCVQQTICFTKETIFLTNDISMQMIHNLLDNFEDDFRTLTKLYNIIWSNMTNRCIKKKAVYLSYSMINENGKWNHIQDKEVYPALTCLLANNLFNFLNAKHDAFRLQRYGMMETLLEYINLMGDFGRCNDVEKSKAILRDFKRLVSFTKMMVVNNSD